MYHNNSDTLYIRRWSQVHVPFDKTLFVDIKELCGKHPVEYLMNLSPAHDTRVVLLRLTWWGSIRRQAQTVSSTTCGLLCSAAGYDSVTTEYGMVVRSDVWFIAWINAFISRIPLLRQLCQYELWILRKRSILPSCAELPCVSIIMPCKNEAGTIAEAIKRMPALGQRTEVICVEGHSTDATLQELERVRDITSHVTVKVITQSGKGKKNAVVEGCSYATGDVLIVFDGDMTVVPEDMRSFYYALIEGRADLVNGSRLLFPLEKHAMRWPNFIFNHIFAWLISYSGILGQKVTDTLCGTKVCWRRDYERSRKEHAWLWNADPFGDFSWLFGIAMLGGKIQDLPVRYYARKYGQPLKGSFRYGIMLASLLWKIGLVRIIRINWAFDK